MGILSALSGIGSLLTGGASAYGAYSASRGASDAPAQQSAMMRQQYSYQKKFWKHQLRQGPTQELAGLRKAGINPMLAYAKASGAGPSPYSSGVSIPAPVNQEALSGSLIASAGSSAAAAFRDLNTGQAAYAAASKVPSEIEQILATTQLTKEQQRTQIAEQQRIFEDQMLKIAQYNKITEEIKLLTDKGKLVRSMQSIAVWTESLEQAKAQAAQMGLAGAEMQATVNESAWARWMEYIKRSTGAVGAVW